MTSIRHVEPVVRICAVISGSETVMETAINWLTLRWGSIADRSDPIDFQAGGFYEPTMGTDLQKVLLAWDDFVDPGELANWKTQTNAWEADLAAQVSSDQPRPINLDPGYVSQAKLVLATIKDRDHRVYLRDGIFGEVTLNYIGLKWVGHRWTYPSYREAAVARFAAAQRDRLRDHLVQHDLFRRA